MQAVSVASVYHSRDGWEVAVGEVSLWRLVVSSVFESAVCVGGVDETYLGYRLLNAFVGIDNGWKNEQYRFAVSDGWAREHVPEFWKEIHDIFDKDNNDAGGSAKPS